MTETRDRHYQKQIRDLTNLIDILVKQQVEVITKLDTFTVRQEGFNTRIDGLSVKLDKVDNSTTNISDKLFPGIT